MSSDTDDRSAPDGEQQMKDEAGQMEAKLEELGDHVADARKKAQVTRADADLPGDEALETVTGDDADERTTSSDDPTSAVGDPADDDK